MNVNSLFKSVRESSQLINYQTLRWRRFRKPFWLGKAKSKMFVIHQPKVIRSLEDKNEYKNLRKLYKVQLASLQNFIQNYNPDCGIDEEFEKSSKGETKEFSLSDLIAKSYEINDKWNAESAKRREIRMKEDMDNEIKNAALIIEAEEEKKRKHMELIEEIIKKEKLLSESYITHENLDEAIENCLNKIESYDFAIDFEGNKYIGRESLTTKPNTDKKELNSTSVV